jgi:hypothetical protein
MSATEGKRARGLGLGRGGDVCGWGMLVLVPVLLVAGCRKEAGMVDHVEMPDTMPVARAMHDPAARDSMLDSIPGGEMARGDSAASMQFLKKKM